MGWYNKPPVGYKSNLLGIVGDFTRQGLPAESGIHLHVADDKKAWFAWRETITGWVFAIGAAKEPPDQWLYDGTAPPSGFPGTDESWGNQNTTGRTKNWY
jgi:hypothetical protein